MNRILLVEDEADLSLIVADTLRSQGYEVIEAVDGIDGLDKFKATGADIVVADVMMPRMDGFSMAKEIRRLSPAVPLLFLTAKSAIDDVEKGFEIGAHDQNQGIAAPIRRQPKRRHKVCHRRIHIQHDDPDAYHGR